jgi:hypothetical protein
VTVIFKKAIHRRTFLRGVGAAIALPLLDGMVPAFASPAAAKSPTRLGFVYVPNGIVMDGWTPKADGDAFEFPPILESISTFRDRLVVLTGLSLNNASRYAPGEGSGDHSVAGATFLTGVHPKRTEGADIRAAVSLDQIVAKEFEKHTQLASLEVSLAPPDTLGICEKGWSCAYSSTISWRGPQTPMPMENNPRLVFERLFGNSDSTNAEERIPRIENERSILDFVAESTTSLMTKLSASDQSKLTQYLDGIRDVERRIQMAQKQSSQELPQVDRPVGIPSNFEEHAKLMFDLQVLAYRTDMTRMITFMLGREVSGRSYPEIGISDPHHPLSHHNGDPEKIAKCLQINIYHAKMFAYYLEKLRSTPDGDGSLLDHTMIVYGAGLSDGNLHSHGNVPIVLVAGQSSQIKGGRHIRYQEDKDTPLANLHLTLLDKLGIPVEKFGDSTGKVEPLSV